MKQHKACQGVPEKYLFQINRLEESGTFMRGDRRLSCKPVQTILKNLVPSGLSCTATIAVQNILETPSENSRKKARIETP
jgi:hypothetical protein